MDSEARKKTKQFSVKLTIERIAQFTVAAEWRGISRASILHNAITVFIRQEADRDPERFNIAVEKEISKILKAANISDADTDTPLMVTSNSGTVAVTPHISEEKPMKRMKNNGEDELNNRVNDNEDDEDDGYEPMPPIGIDLPEKDGDYNPQKN